MPKEDHVIVEFYTEAVRDGKASAEAGREIFKEDEFCRVYVIGDRDNNLVIRAHEPFTMDRKSGGMITAAERWPDHYRVFKSNQADAIVGTPLDHLPFMGKAQIAEMNHHGIRTAEQLAGLSEAALSKGYNWRDLRAQAKVWLDDADKNAVAAKALAERDAAEARLAALEAKLAALESEQKPVRKAS